MIDCKKEELLCQVLVRKGFLDIDSDGIRGYE